MNSVPIGVLICAAAARLLLVPLLVTRSKVADMRGCVAVYVLNRFDADKSGSLDHSDLALLLAEEETRRRKEAAGACDTTQAVRKERSCWRWCRALTG